MEQESRSDHPKADECQECGGTGVVIHWNEFSHFEDRRSCQRCHAGRLLETRIAKIIAKTQAEDTEIRA